jgi:aspartate 1-decarboxylase
MFRTMLIGKLHRAVVTATRIDDPCLFLVDPDLLDEVGILAGEQIQVTVVQNSRSFTTAAIPGVRGSREVVVCGPAARDVQPGDQVIIAAYGLVPAGEAVRHQARSVTLGPANANAMAVA